MISKVWWQSVLTGRLVLVMIDKEFSSIDVNQSLIFFRTHLDVAMQVADVVKIFECFECLDADGQWARDRQLLARGALSQILYERMV